MKVLRSVGKGAVSGLKIGGGVVGAEYLGGFVEGMLPANDGGMIRSLATPAIVLGVSGLARRYVGSEVADGMNVNAVLHVLSGFLGDKLDVDYGGTY